jgi:hypothetical protein
MFKRASRKEDNAAEPSDKAAEKRDKAEAKAAAKRDKAAAKLAKRAEKRAKSVESRAKPAEPQVYRKPRADIYTVMLSVALIAAALASTALWMTMGEYHNEIKGGPNPTWNRPAALDAPRAVV